MPQITETCESDNLTSCLGLINNITSAMICSVISNGRLTALKDMLLS